MRAAALLTEREEALNDLLLVPVLRHSDRVQRQPEGFGFRALVPSDPQQSFAVGSH